MELGQAKPVQALDRKPDLFEDVAEVWEAFWVLNKGRDIGFGPGFIKLSEIAAYLTMFPHPRPAFFIRGIQALDSVYLSDYSKKKTKSGKTGSASTGKAKHGRRSRTRTKGK
jgi:hypothetical protein